MKSIQLIIFLLKKSNTIGRKIRIRYARKMGVVVVSFLLIQTSI